MARAAMDGRGNHSPEGIPEEQSLTAQQPEWARERENRHWYETPAAAAQTSQQAKPKAETPTKLIVVIPHEGGDDWAKARVFDSPGKATALVEMLVGDGLAPEQVSVFNATQMVVSVDYRPVVKLKASRKQAKSSA
jgi:hypothetical protein